jgi:hypothetical protein
MKGNIDNVIQVPAADTQPAFQPRDTSHNASALGLATEKDCVRVCGMKVFKAFES